MPATKTNTETVQCYDCETEIAPEQGNNIPWSNNFVCGPCKAQRDQKAEELRISQTKAGDVLTRLIPSIEKLGSIVKVRSGQGEYESKAYILRDGQYYKIAVQPVDEQEMKSAY